MDKKKQEELNQKFWDFNANMVVEHNACIKAFVVPMMDIVEANDLTKKWAVEYLKKKESKKRDPKTVRVPLQKK